MKKHTLLLAPRTYREAFRDLLQVKAKATKPKRGRTLPTGCMMGVERSLVRPPRQPNGMPFESLDSRSSTSAPIQ